MEKRNGFVIIVCNPIDELYYIVAENTSDENFPARLSFPTDVCGGSVVEMSDRLVRKYGFRFSFLEEIHLLIARGLVISTPPSNYFVVPGQKFHDLRGSIKDNNTGLYKLDEVYQRFSDHEQEIFCRILRVRMLRDQIFASEHILYLLDTFRKILEPTWSFEGHAQAAEQGTPSRGFKRFG